MFLWIWKLEESVNKYGDINGLISKLKDLKVKNICIKYHEGSSYIGGGIDYRADFLKYVSDFKSNGFSVGTWGYNYFNNVEKEGNIIIEALTNSDYYIFDPEVDVSGKINQAEQICSVVRGAHPSANIGYSSFPIVSYHEDIPYSVFNKYCDFASPQVYWGEMQWSVNRCLDKMLEDHKNYGLDKPIYPSIQTYNCDLPSYEVFQGYGFSEAGAWSFDEIDDIATKFISGNNTQNINGHNVINNNKNISNDAIKVLQEELNILIGAGLVVDGIQGVLTTAAVEKFQGIMGLIEDGIAGTKTLGAIKEIRSYPLDGIDYPHYEYATRWIQWITGAQVDGIFGAKSAEKVKAWQNMYNNKNGANLAVDGIVGPKTWAAMVN